LKKFITMLLVAAFTLSFAVGCGQPSTKKPDETKKADDTKKDDTKKDDTKK
jgi:hypothetical protein